MDDDDVLVEMEDGPSAEYDGEDYDGVGSDVRDEIYAMEELYVDEAEWDGTIRRTRTPSTSIGANRALGKRKN